MIFNSAFKADDLANNRISIFVSTQGSDSFSGRYSEPNNAKTDGPFQTIQKARDYIRQLKTQGGLTKPISVLIKAGTYEFDQALEFTTADSGTSATPITYRGYGGDVNLSGGKKITSSWAKCTAATCPGLPDPAKVYYTDLKTDINFKNNHDFSSLYINETRATRARTPNMGANADQSYYKLLSNPSLPNNDDYSDPKHDPYKIGFNFNSGEINPSWKNLTDIEVVVLNRFQSSRKKIESINSNYLKLKGDNLQFPYDWDYNHRSRYYLENVYEGVDTAGEWYLDKTTSLLYYYPKTNESIANLNVVAPKITQLLDVKGLPDNFTNFSISHWIKTTDLGNEAVTVSNGDFRFGLNSGQISYFIAYDPLEPYFSGGGCGNGGLSDGNWHMITGVFDRIAKTFTCYIDDGAASGNTQTLSLPKEFSIHRQTPPVIGKYDAAPGYNGRIDNLKMFNRPITSSEVKQLYQNQNITSGQISDLNFESNLTDNGQYSWENWKKDSASGVISTTMPVFAEGKFGQSIVFDGSDFIKNNFKLASPERKNFVSYLSFQNLHFQYTDSPMREPGNNGSQEDTAAPIPPAVKASFSSYVKFTNNTFSQIGGYAIIAKSSDNLYIDSNNFSDLGSGGVLIGEGENESFYTNNNTISNNTVSDFGKVILEGVGLMAMRVSDTSITHNEVSDGPNIGISMGWWTQSDIGTNNNTVSYNKVHHTMKLLNDGAGIYVNGYQKNTYISNNIIHDILITPQHQCNFINTAIYLDGHSSNLTAQNNITYNNSSSVTINTPTTDNVVKNNIFIGGAQSPIYMFYPIRATFSNNIIYTKENTPSLIAGGVNNTTMDSQIQDNNIYYNPATNNNFYMFTLTNWDINLNSHAYTNQLYNDFLKSLNNKNIDKNSLFVDPLFVDVDNNNYSLRENSPALGLGFQQINTIGVGPIQVLGQPTVLATYPPEPAVATPTPIIPPALKSKAPALNLSPSLKPSLSVEKIQFRATRFRVDYSSSLKNETVTIKNTGNIPVDLNSWKIKNFKGQNANIPSYTIYPNQTVTIHTGRNTKRVSYKVKKGRWTYKRWKTIYIKTSPGHIYLQRTKELWSNKHDTVKLYNPKSGDPIQKSY